MRYSYSCMASVLPSVAVPEHGRLKKWIPIVPWIDSVVDESDSSVIIRYARDKAGRA